MKRRFQLEEDEDEYEEIYSAYITLKNGKRIYASSYGLKAFCFRVKKKKK